MEVGVYMARGDERIERIMAALQQANLDALVCTHPTNVLLLSGYWPVVGASIVVATRDGRVAVLAPEDERDLADGGWAGTVRTFQSGSLESLPDVVAAVEGPVARELGATGARVGHEDGDFFEQSSYAAMHYYGPVTAPLLGRAMPGATLTLAADLIKTLRAALTGDELARVRAACQVAGEAFERGAAGLRAGLREPEAAALFETPLSVVGLGRAGVARAGGFVYCMSGENSARAGSAYARTRDRAMLHGDLVLIHCNSYVDGYWTDITRTYCLGEPSERQRAIHDAIFAARAAALAVIRPGARAADVDAAARAVLRDRGFGAYFTHGLGHNVGFTAISTDGPPRLHPASDDVLESGMVFNVEPAVYIAGYGGARHCDVVTVTADGAQVLTPFQATIEELTVDTR